MLLKKVETTKILVERGDWEELELTPNQFTYLSKLRTSLKNQIAFEIRKTPNQKSTYKVRALGCAGIVDIDDKLLLIRPRLTIEGPDTNDTLH